MTYQINQVNPDNRSSWFTPQQCKDYYKVPYQFREIQIHWWDDPSQKPSHDGVVSYIKKKTGGSVNYVVSAGKITRMVTEENCALTTQNGNPYGIKLECSPYGTDEDYRTIGWLVADIQRRRGRLPLVPHKKYWSTDCPGTLSLTRIQAEADKFTTKEEDMPSGNEPRDYRVNQGDIINMWRVGGMPGDPPESYIKAWMGQPWKQFMYDITAQKLWRSSDKGQAMADPDGEKWRGLVDDLRGSGL